MRYDKLCKSSESIPMQSILVPQYSEATNDEMNLVEEERETLLDLGFDVELGGPTKIKLVGAPVRFSRVKKHLKFCNIYSLTYMIINSLLRPNYDMKC